MGLVSLLVCSAGTFSVAAGRNDSEDEQTVGLYKRLAPATVFLSSVYTSDHPMLDPTATGVGAGFILDQDGTVLTNAHVVERASAITATLFDGGQVRVEVIGSDPETDLAVLRLPRDKGPYATVPLGDSDQLAGGTTSACGGQPVRARLHVDVGDHQWSWAVAGEAGSRRLACHPDHRADQSG